MDNKKFRNGMFFGIVGAILTLLGDLLIGANPASEITTGSQMVDMFMMFYADMPKEWSDE